MTAEGEWDVWQVLPEEAGKRLDSLLVDHYEQAQSRSYFQKLIADQKVLLNQNATKKRIQPSEGDCVEVSFVFNEELNLIPEPIPLDILYEDSSIIVVNKPVGMVVHPAPGHWTGTFVHALLGHCSIDSTAGSMQQRPGIVHRLDKDTSGVLLGVKTQQAYSSMVEQFASRKVGKEYLAICRGKPKEGAIDAPLARHPHNRKKQAVIETGKPARSHITRLAEAKGQTCLRVSIETGRTHQIRVHLAHLGCPLLGDALYGGNDVAKAAPRQMLHAWKLSCHHPETNQPLEFVAPPPEDFCRRIAAITSKSWREWL